MAKGNDGSAARRRTMKKLMIASGVALGFTFVIVYYGSGDSSVHNAYGRYQEGVGGRDWQLPGEGRRARGRDDDGSESLTSSGQDDNRNGFLERFKTTKRFKKGGPGGRYPGGFGRRDSGSRGDDDGNGGGFMKRRKFGDYSRQRIEIEEEGDDSSIDMDVIDEKVAAQFRKELINHHRNPEQAEKVLDGILNASINIVDIAKTYKLKSSTDGTYKGVIAEFCKLDFAPYKNDPSKYPMFRFIVQNSPDCRANTMNFDLRKIAYLTRWYDQKIAKSPPSNEDPKVLNITAVAFHESRCGSTLVANSMIAMDPVKHRTYSEAAPPIKAFFICNDEYELCTQKQSAAILKDTMYLMSRTNDHREERVFFKYQSMISKSITTFQMAYPDVPWMYVYREPVQVLMSHYKDDPTMKRAICTKFKRKPSLEMYRIAKRHGREGPQALSGIEFCAAHITQLTEAAVDSLNDMAIPVAYDQLPNMLWEKIMPKIFGRPLEQFEIDNLEAISKTYSKGGTHSDRKGEFKDDSKAKEKRAPPDVRDAAAEFLQESFDALDAFESKLLL